MIDSKRDYIRPDTHLHPLPNTTHIHSYYEPSPQFQKYTHVATQFEVSLNHSLSLSLFFIYFFRLIRNGRNPNDKNMSSTDYFYAK